MAEETTQAVADTAKTVDVGAIRGSDVNVFDAPKPATEVSADDKSKAAVETKDETPEQKQAREVRDREDKDKSFKRVLRSKDKWKDEALKARERLRMYEEGKVKPADDKAKPEAPAEPKRENFDKYEDFIEARAEFKAEQRAEQILDKRMKEREEKDGKAKIDAEDSKLRESWDAQLEKARERYADYDQKTSNEDYNPTPTMARAIMESELGSDISYVLSNDLDECERIAGLSPVRQIAEIGKLEAKLASDPKFAKVTAPQTKTSKAPLPIKPVDGTTSIDSAPSEKDDMTDWMKKRQRQVHGKR